MDNNIGVSEVLGSEHDVHSVSPSASDRDHVEAASVEYYVRDLELTNEKIKWLWQRFMEFPQAWDDYMAGNFQAFCQVLGNRNSVFLEIFADREGKQPVGLLSASNIIPHHMAEVHCVFWDRSFQGRDEVAKDLLKTFFREFDLKRVSAFVPETNRPACKFAKRIGMRHEGTLRRAALYQSQYIDMIAFGLLREEAGV